MKRRLPVAVVLVATLFLLPHVASATDCQEITDCLANDVRGSIAALAGVALLIGLIVAPEIFGPILIAKGIAEAITGRDLLTGERLDWTDRALGVLPVLGEYGQEARTASQVIREGEQLGQESRFVRYGELDENGWPTGVQARLTDADIGTGTPASRSIRPPGFGGQPAGHARGHLLGNQLGGSGTDPRNIVTIYQNPANSPVMRGFENQVRAALEDGQTVDYRVTPINVGSDPVPRGITMEATGSGGLDLHVTVLNRGL